MADVVPFCGEMYDPEKIGGFRQVIAPPYDVISDAELRHLRQRSPHNIAHLLLAPKHATDTDSNNRYTRTAEMLKHWRWTGVLQRDDQPAYYLYEQQFAVHELDDVTYHTRRALLARVRLEPFDARVVFPHEKTLAAPKEDRLNLLRTCHTNLSPIFGLYSDPDNAIDGVIEELPGKHPAIDVQWSEERTEHFWQLRDPKAVQQIQQYFASRPIVIADGHHRYETSLFYRDEYLQQHPEHEGCKYVLMALVRMESPGLVVLPIHRLIQGLPADRIEAGRSRLHRFFEIRRCNSPSDLLHILHHSTGTAFGFTSPSLGCALLSLKEDSGLSSYLDPTHSDIYNQLDVTRLHAVVLKECFGVDTAIVEQQQHVRYTEDAHEAVQEVSSGHAQCAFFLNPTRVDQVRDVAMVGETMPQKSTFFHPKLMTGLVLNPLD